MADVENPQPGSHEIRKQLARILSSSEFVTREKPGQVFRLLVESALERRSLSEEDIRAEAFGSHYAPGTHVRTTVNTIRTLLAEYYEGDGRYDAVRIELPVKFSKTAPRKVKGQSYPVICSYNPFRKDLSLLKMARRIMGAGAPTEVRKALAVFDTILHRQPLQRAARISKAECLCLLALYHPDSRPNKDLIGELMDLTASLIDEDMSDVDALILFAVEMALIRSGHGTLTVLRRAQHVDSARVESSLWLPFICLLMGYPKPARSHAHSIADERGDDLTAMIALGFYHYFAREFKDAEERLLIAAYTNKHSWLANLGLAFVYLALDNAREALHYYLLSDKLLGDEPPFLPMLAVVISMRTPAGIEGLWDSSPRLTTAVVEFNKTQETSVDYVQMAILNVDRHPERAIGFLRMAVRNAYPLALIAPCWPIFDSLDLTTLFDKENLPPFWGDGKLPRADLTLT